MGLDADAWASFAHDPRDPAHAVLRAGDADRVLTANLLTEAYAEGRIDLAEHDERAELAQSARLLGDLVPLLDDLVPVLPPSPSTSAGLTVAARADLEVRAHQEWAAQRRSAVMGFIAPTLITWAVFVAIVLSNPDAWHFPWPLIVMAATGVNLLRVHVQRADIVADEAIAAKVAPSIWGEAMEALIDEVRAGRPGHGMAEAVRRMGIVLAEHFPKSDGNPNELPDRLIEL